MRRIGYVSLITRGSSGLLATQAPVLLDTTEGEHGRLLGHIARSNPQWQDRSTREALAVFTGPSAYISPQWYAAKREHGRVVPTWNYVAIHAYGEVSFCEDREWLREIVTRLTEAHESQFQHPWQVSDAPADYIDGMLNAIIAFELRITRLESSWKLSQNRSEADRQGAMAGLRERGEKIVEEMERLNVPPSENKER